MVQLKSGKVSVLNLRINQKHFLVSVLTSCLALTSCASNASEGNHLVNEGDIIESPYPIFGVIGYAEELEYIGDAGSYFSGYDNVAHNMLAARVTLDIVSNVIGYTDEKKISILLAIGQSSEVDPVRGPIFVVGEKADEGIIVHDWGRLTTSICMESKISERAGFPDFRVNELGRYDPEYPNRYPISNVKSFSLTENDIDTIQDRDKYRRKDEKTTCFETRYGQIDNYANFKKNIKRKLKIAK